MQKGISSRSHLIPSLLLGSFIALWIWAAIDPSFRLDWIAENVAVFVFAPAIIISYFKWRLPMSTYVLFTVALGLHVIGSHWTYSNVPIPWESWGFARNPYDRFVHCASGLLLTFPFADIFRRILPVNYRASIWLSFQYILAASAIYEIIEWISAELLAKDLVAAFVGMQGDTFDAVKDISSAVLGSLVIIGVMAVYRRFRQNRVK